MSLLLFTSISADVTGFALLDKKWQAGKVEICKTACKNFFLKNSPFKAKTGVAHRLPTPINIAQNPDIDRKIGKLYYFNRS